MMEIWKSKNDILRVNNAVAEAGTTKTSIEHYIILLTSIQVFKYLSIKLLSCL